ncbi:putative p protein [Erysiphe necator]|uniref:Putative p protein n=1 Tax=Uncinula necator TaxID=52586 RepID=A0A0B1NX28_UNCNE|nr:putative p protein [Erysiphe necator]
MMTSLAHSYTPHPGGIPQHTGIAQGHPMSHNPSHPGQPGPVIPQQMHMGVSAPGPTVPQGQVLMSGIPSGVGGPGGHVLQHLSPGQQQAQAQAQAQAQLFQQQAMFASNPQLQHMQQQNVQLMAQRQQAQRNALMAQQYRGIPMGIPNEISGVTPAQFQAMRGQAGPMRPVSLPQHLMAQQQQAEQTLQQQQQAQAQAQHHYQQQMIMAQQLAIHQQANPHSQSGSNQGQSNQINQQSSSNLQQTPNPLMQQHHQQQSQALVAASQQNQNQPHSQNQIQANPQTSQIGPSQIANQHQVAVQQQVAMMQQQQQRQGERMKGQCLMKLMLFADYLGNFTSGTNALESYMARCPNRLAAQGAKQRDDLNHWTNFVETFFSPKGVLRHSVWVMDEKSNKQYEITFPALPRYFNTHFESGIKSIQMILERGSEKELPNNFHYIESQKSSFVYWFESGAQVVASGSMKAHFDSHQKIELLEFNTNSHEEYLPRTQVVEAARPLHIWGKEWHKVNSSPDNKTSPEINKKKPKLMKSPPQPPPGIELPVSKVKTSMGITHSVFRFLELAEVMIQMNSLFAYSHQNPKLTPSNALDQYVANITANIGVNMGHQQSFVGSRTSAIGNLAMGASPAQGHMQLSGSSPHIGSPAQAPGTLFHTNQHGTSPNGPNANLSPNSNNKRRRPSGVKLDEESQLNGMHQNPHVKPSPRIGGKRQKVNQA